MLSLCLCALFAPSPSSLPTPTISTSVLESSVYPITMLLSPAMAAPAVWKSDLPFCGNASTLVGPGIRSNTIPSGKHGLVIWYNSSNGHHSRDALRENGSTSGITRPPRHLHHGPPCATNPAHESQIVYNSRTSPPAMVATPAELTVFDSKPAIGADITISSDIWSSTTSSLLVNLTSDDAVIQHACSSRSCGSADTALFVRSTLVKLAPVVAAHRFYSQGGAIAKFPDIFSDIFLPPASTILFNLTSDNAVILHAHALQSGGSGGTAYFGLSTSVALAPLFSAQATQGGAIANFSDQISPSFSSIFSASLTTILDTLRLDVAAIWHACSSLSYGAFDAEDGGLSTLVKLARFVYAQKLYTHSFAFFYNFLHFSYPPLVSVGH
jgi:hypothetical protein